MLTFSVLQFRSENDGTVSVNMSGSGYCTVKLTAQDQQELQNWLDWHKRKPTTAKVNSYQERLQQAVANNAANQTSMNQQQQYSYPVAQPY